MVSVLYSFILTAFMILLVPVRIPIALYYMTVKLIEEEKDVRIR